MTIYNKYRAQFEEYLESEYKLSEPTSLYEAVHYILHIGGKRFRPVLLLLAADTFGELTKSTFQAALGLEIFHNFTLVHDDIMDNARLRRGALTVHEKYNKNTAILAGDVMLIESNQYIAQISANTGKPDLLDLFLKTAREICEGQQYDMDYEKSTVGLDDYIEMIRLKTAVLLGLSLYLGARLADLSMEHSKVLYEYGVNAGIAFQVWDDYLDVFGTDDTGKKRAGDIYNKKETYLIIQLRASLSEEEKNKFQQIWGRDISSTDCAWIIEMMNKYQIDESTQDFSRRTLDTAIKRVKEQLPDPDRFSPIIAFTKQFISRDK